MQPGILVQPDRPSDMSASSKSWPRSFYPLGCLAGQGWHAQLERRSPASPRRRTTALPRPRGRPVSGLATAAPGLRSGPSSRTGSLHAGPRRARGPVSPSPPLRLPSRCCLFRCLFPVLLKFKQGGVALACLSNVAYSYKPLLIFVAYFAKSAFWKWSSP